MGISQEKGDNYEEFIAQLLDGVINHGREIRNIKFGKTNIILGVSGCEHQIDVSFVDYTFDEPTLVLIECKNTPSVPVKKVQVAAFKAIMDDIVNEPSSPKYVLGIFAYAAKEAQSGAIKFAKYYGIEMERTGMRPNFTFKYQNLIQAGIRLENTSDFKCSGEVV